MRMRRAHALCLAAGLCAILAWLCLFDGLAPKLFAARGTFYYWTPGYENTAGFGEWGGPDPLEMFKERLWDKRPDDFSERVVRRLVDSYGMDEERSVDADTAIRSICFCHTSISFTWQDIIAVSRDPVLAAYVANAAMDVLYELDLGQEQLRKERAVSQLAAACERELKARDDIAERVVNAKSDEEKLEAESRLVQLTQVLDNLKGRMSLYQEMDVRTNTMFKIMIPAGVATNAVSGRFARRIRELQERWGSNR